MDAQTIQEQQWQALEAERTRELDSSVRWENGQAVFLTGFKFTAKPHPASYRPDIPLRSSLGAINAWADALIRKQGAQKRAPTIRASSPHPQSYRPDLPLGHFTDAQLVKATADDRAYWAEHPLTYTRRA